MRAIPLTLISAFSLMLVACSEPESQAPKQEAKPAEVDVALPLQHKLTDWDEFTGRFEAIDNVNLRARVTGYLVEKKFKDGQQVKKGDVLYVIDPRPFRYELNEFRRNMSWRKKSWIGLIYFVNLMRFHKKKSTDAFRSYKLQKHL